MPGSLGAGAQLFKTVAEAGGVNPSVYVGESYDAAALIVLAMQAGGSSDKGLESALSDLEAEFEKIMAGEIAKGLKLLASGKELSDITGVAFTSVGEAEGAFIEKGISGGNWTDVAQR